MLNNIYNLFLRRLFSFKGRSRRGEYIARVFLLTILIFIRIYYIDKYRYIEIQPLFAILNIFTALFLLIYTIQYFPLAIRRLHDLNASGWYFFITFLPFGQLLILWLMFKKGTPGPNRYGPPPEK